MALRVHNTKTRTVEPFSTLKPGLVRMYVCGPSVYDRSHLGHARSYVTYDVMRRYFHAKGFEVEHVQNFTDVEESIAERAKARGIPPLALADEFIHAFFEDMDALRVLRADHYPRASEHVEEIVRIVQDLLEDEKAYASDCHDGTRDGEPDEVCDVYFDVSKHPGFGALVGASPDELAVDHPSGKGERRHAMDFALWKSRDDWGVKFPSPWGDGRPGWHVECSAMSLKFLGPHFDLHGGGLDLVFPHHESEQAIAEAWTKQTYTGAYVHNGFVTVGARKMSKSLKNFVTVEELLARHDAEALRMLLVSHHYRAPLDYEPAAIDAAAARLARWKAAAAALARSATGASGDAERAPAGVREARAAFWAAMEDDFHLERACAAVDDAVARSAGLAGAEAAGALAFLREVADALGVMWPLESRWKRSPVPSVPGR